MIKKKVCIYYDTTPEDTIDIVKSILDSLGVKYEIEEDEIFVITYKINETK